MTLFLIICDIFRKKKKIEKIQKNLTLFFLSRRRGGRGRGRRKVFEFLI